jgi:hypothetical protein
MRALASVLLSLLALLAPPRAGLAGAPPRPAAAPVIANIATNLASYPNSRVPRYAKLEISFDLTAAFANPFDPAQVSVEGRFVAPDQAVLAQPGFYYQEYITTTTAGGQETYTPAGAPGWRIRFAPQQAGRYQYTIVVTDSAGTAASSPAWFDVVDAGRPGFVRVSSQNNRYFGFDDGRPFIGVGLNVAWWQSEQQRISSYAYSFGRMSEHKANLARVWMTNSGKDQYWILSIQDKTLGADYNLEEAWAFDHILEMARQKGIYLLLTLDDVNQYTYNWPANLYNTAQGGPCVNPSCVFTSPAAAQYQERVFRYIVARWGYSPHILSWELFNEINELEWSTANWDWCRVTAWHQEIARAIASIDAHRHLVNSSTGSFKTYGGTCSGASSAPNLYAAPEMQFAQIHYYYVAGCCAWAPSDPAGRDMADLTRYYARLVHNSVSDKPAIIGEWGILNAQWTDSPFLADDDTGVHLHEGLWSSIMSGMAATGLGWHWGHYRDHDPAWWRHYLGIANYLADIDIQNLGVLKPLNVDFSLPGGADNRPDAFASTNGKLRVMGLGNGHSAYVWIENVDNTWWNAVHGAAPGPQSGTVTVYHLAPGARYAVTRWDAYAGQASGTEAVTASAGGAIQIAIQGLATDIAFKIRPDTAGLTRRAFLPRLLAP